MKLILGTFYDTCNNVIKIKFKHKQKFVKDTKWDYDTVCISSAKCLTLDIFINVEFTSLSKCCRNMNPSSMNKCHTNILVTFS